MVGEGGGEGGGRGEREGGEREQCNSMQNKKRPPLSSRQATHGARGWKDGVGCLQQSCLSKEGWDSHRLVEMSTISSSLRRLELPGRAGTPTNYPRTPVISTTGRGMRRAPYGKRDLGIALPTFCFVGGVRRCTAQRAHPRLFEQIARRVAEGRWIPVGGSWVEFDWCVHASLSRHGSGPLRKPL